MRIKLETKSHVDKVILDYLEKNASDLLVDKINNGVVVTQDGKQLINKKTLAGFWDYAYKQAREIAEKGSKATCTADEVVFGWAIHYFEEESIVESLYNLDGTPYKVATPQVNMSVKTSAPVKTKTKQEQNGQCSFFDVIDDKPTDTDEDDVDEEDIDEETDEYEQPASPQIVEQVNKPIATVSLAPMYIRYKELQDAYPDVIIAMRVGDFYEIFGDNAVIVSRELDLTLTGRNVGFPERMPMVGFPYHMAEVYAQKIAKNHKVALGSNLEDLTFHTPQVEEDDFDLTEEEMRLFDGSVALSTVVEMDEADSSENNSAHYDKYAVDIVMQLLGNIIKVG